MNWASGAEYENSGPVYLRISTKSIASNIVNKKPYGKHSYCFFCVFTLSKRISNECQQSINKLSTYQKSIKRISKEYQQDFKRVLNKCQQGIEVLSKEQEQNIKHISTEYQNNIRRISNVYQHSIKRVNSHTHAPPHTPSPHASTQPVQAPPPSTSMACYNCDNRKRYLQ